MYECCDIDQLIVNAAFTFSHGIMSKPLCTLWAYILIIWNNFCWINHISVQCVLN